MRQNAMALLEAAYDDDGSSYDPDNEDVGFDPGGGAAVGFDPGAVGAAIRRVRATGLRLTPANLAQALAARAHQMRNASVARAQETSLTGQVPAGVIGNSSAIGIGATVVLTITSYIPLRIFRVDGEAVVTATGLAASGSVLINFFQFANRGIFDGTGTPTLSVFRPDAAGRPPIRNIVVYPNTPIQLSLTNNNAAAVTAGVNLYGSTP